MKGYPRWFQPALLVGCLGLYVSGCLLAPTTLQLRADWALGWRLAADARIGMAALHAASALAVLMFIGALWSVHMRSGWRRRRQKASGLLVVLPALLLALTGVAVYYLANEALANVAAFVHLGVGAVLLLPFLWHMVAGRRLRRRHQHR
jgi:heme A synthase